MHLFHSLDAIRGRIPAPAVTVGSFDGVHAGHRAILRTLADTAARQGGQGVVVTFDPHPRQVVGEDGVQLLTTLEEKLFLLEKLGVDNVLVVPFTPEFARLDSEEFARTYLLDGIGARSVVTGYNHRFGRGRTGGGEILSPFFEVVPVPKLDVDAGKVSSTVIRGLIRTGDLTVANRLLVDPYFLITDGDGRYDHPEKLLPPDGTYPVTANEIPTRLTIREGKPLLPTGEGKIFFRFY
jgi:riboflavin kinase/FMN adenylyltransferase